MATAVQKESNSNNSSGTGPSGDAPNGVAIGAKKSRRPIVFVVLGVVVLAAFIYGVRFAAWAQTHTSTDDATITSDVVQIAPQVSGTVISVPVKENLHVKKGDLLVQLDSSSFETALAQAKANLSLAIAQAKGAHATVELTKQSAAAQVMQAKGLVGQSSGGVSSSISEAARARAAVAQAKAQASGASASYYGAQANVSIALANKQKAMDAVNSAQAQLDTARAGLNTAKANAEAAKATADNAAKQAERNETLFGQGAISGQINDQTKAAAEVAKAQVAASQQQVAQAQAVVVQRQADLRAAKNQLPAADAAVAQARALLRASHEQELAAREAVNQTRAQVGSAVAAIEQARARGTQAEGQLEQAQVGPTQIAVSETAELQANAKVEQAKAAVRDAEINLSRTRILAPVNGRISKNTVEVGNLVQPGGALMAIVPDEDMWVTANYKETQLVDVKAGQKVEVEVDAMPGRTFEGHVDSISAGTGSTFALLPADNATGNFTKVVQRVSVKILLEHNQPGMDRLRSGMSVTATIITK